MRVLALLLHGLLQVAGLQLTELAGPKFPDKGENVRLTCKYDTQGAKLYSVKWYKDENEFYRYMPDYRPRTQVFPLVGVLLDESLSGKNSVLLKDVEFSSSGSYRCEVSTDAPSFETVFSNHNMTVLAYPQEEPALWGVQEGYSAGDLVTVNCTAPSSHPAPSIRFYTNHHLADEWLIERGPQVRHQDDTTSTSAVLKFQAERQHFLGPDEVLELGCEVLAPPLPASTVTRHVHLVTSPNQRLAQKTFRNYGVAVYSQGPTLLTLLVTSWWLCLLL